MHAQYPDSPFLLQNVDSYAQWRESKLRDYPQTAQQLVVAVENPLALSRTEHEAMLALLRKTNMVIYTAQSHHDDARIPLSMGERFGLHRLDHNYLAENSGLSAITVSESGEKPQFIPYTSKALQWHTDGYYNSGENLIRGFILHCVNDAAEGGENALLDHEMVYMLMRDENPDYIRAMMQTDMMTIPPRTDEDGIARPEVTGPVFQIDPSNGALHMRYTARKRNIHWRNDALSREALACLESLLEDGRSPIFRSLLTPGMGLVCNNVLHNRAAFHDSPEHGKRLLYRARYYDRVGNT